MTYRTFKIVRLSIHIAILVILTGITSADDGRNQQTSWLQQARLEANQDGYALITIHDLKVLYDSGKEFTTIDVRPEYEFHEGHLPHAISIEFDLGDKLELKSDKKLKFISLLGQNINRTIVIYCRSFA
jgi:3-mercaptopyruvate sulfurtransferase SseA